MRSELADHFDFACGYRIIDEEKAAVTQTAYYVRYEFVLDLVEEIVHLRYEIGSFIKVVLDRGTRSEAITPHVSLETGNAYFPLPFV